jgi:hypothetical protein
MKFFVTCLYKSENINAANSILIGLDDEEIEVDVSTANTDEDLLNAVQNGVQHLLDKLGEE